jgi:hypothetical protein
MKRALWGILFLLFAINYSFSELQVDSGLGWFFEGDTYTESSESRRISGPMLHIDLRYFLNSSWGVLVGIDSDITLFADYDDSLKILRQQGIRLTIYKDFGDKISLKLGISWERPINNKFSVQADGGFLFTPFGIETITGDALFQGNYLDLTYNRNFRNMGIFGNILGSYMIHDARKWYITFGLRLTFLFGLDEDIEVTASMPTVVSGQTVYVVSSQSASDKPGWFGLGIAPFIGFMGKY